MCSEDEDPKCQTGSNFAIQVSGSSVPQKQLSLVTRKKLEGFAIGCQEIPLTLTPRTPITEPSNFFEEQDISDRVQEPRKPQSKYTPLERQFLDIKKDYPDAIIFVECGYKYRLFGQDAQVASKHLNICCNVTEHVLPSASIPVHRLNVHVRRLVVLGYKVGVVKQTETTALKAQGDRRNDLFERKLTALYTRATLIGQDVDNSDQTDLQDDAPFIVCLYETQASSPKNTVKIGLIGVSPSTGEGYHWWGHETSDRTGLEYCLTQLQPAEILLPISSLSSVTRALVTHLVKIRLHTGDHVRTEELEEKYFDYASGLLQLSDLFRDGPMELSGLSPEVVCATAALLTYLEGFRLKDVLKSSRQLVPLTLKDETLHLGSDCLRNLEVFENSSNQKEHGSLFWALNKTKTAFGKRLLRRWLAKPLKCTRSIVERQDVVEEILCSQSPVVKELTKLLDHLPDLETSLCATLQLRVSTEKFYLLSHHLFNIHTTVCRLQDRARAEIQSQALRVIFEQIPELLKHVPSFYRNINSEAAKALDMTSLFNDISMYDSIVECRSEIADTEAKLDIERTSIARVLGQLAFNYATVSGHEYLIEVRNSQVSGVPKTWVKISGTKQVSRFHSPQVALHFKTLCMLREKHKATCLDAWNTFLRAFNDHFFSHRAATGLVASLDVYCSLAAFARQDGYCRPRILEREDKSIRIVDGRHPVVEKLMSESGQYVANSTDLNASRPVMILTGPNMGGKSSYVRQVALITLLAHLGAHVPALEASISVLDGIYTRMGAKDFILEHRSTFMVEMQETSEIVRRVSEHSLVILDELGRGTSTHDGTAIAFATLQYLLTKVHCLTLFVTHYHPVTEIETGLSQPTNYHMSFILQDKDGKSDETRSAVTFLYQLKEGTADGSYGTNVGRLAGLPTSILDAASRRANVMSTQAQLRRSKSNWLRSILTTTDSTSVKLFIRENI